jgi:hypothetical protein
MSQRRSREKTKIILRELKSFGGLGLIFRRKDMEVKRQREMRLTGFWSEGLRNEFFQGFLKFSHATFVAHSLLVSHAI